jgi:signal transduction histidine kinase
LPINRPPPYRRILRWLATFVLLWLSAASVAQAATIGLTAERLSVPLAGSMSVLRDVGASLDLAGAQAADRAGSFTTLPGNLAAGYSRDAFWLRFSLQRGAADPAEWWLEIEPAMLDHLTLYAPDAAGHYRAHESGDAVPLREHDVDYRFSIFRLQPPPGSSTYYLRVRTDSTIAVQPTLWQPREFARRAALEGNLLGIFYGLLLLALLFSLVFWIWFKEPLYRSYIVHLSALTLCFAATNGYLYQYLLPAWPWANDMLTYLATLAITATGCWYFAAFIKLELRFPRLNRLFRTFAIVALLAAIPTLFGYFPLLAPPLFVATAAMTVLGSALLLILWFRRDLGAGLFLIAFAVFNFGVLGVNLRNIGLLPPGFLINNALQIGIAIHIVILHLALALRLRDAERDKLQAQASALSVSRRAEQELEQKIMQRTAELSASNRALQRNEKELREAKEQAESIAASERQLHEEERHLLELLAHEFRSPLAIIGNTAQTLRRLKDGDEQLVRSKGERIFSAVSRLANLIDNCLSDARLNSLDRPLQPETVALAATLARITAPYQHDMHHRWQIDLPPKQLEVSADPILLDLALSNLLENAAKYAPTASVIHVFSSFDSSQVSIAIHDQGPGIPAELHSDIFKKFIRGGGHGASNTPPGAGLGLYLVKRIALLHGGDVLLDSAPGQGTTFTLRLPMR